MLSYPRHRSGLKQPVKSPGVPGEGLTGCGGNCTASSKRANASAFVSGRCFAHLIARVYAVEDRAKALALSGEQRLISPKRASARLKEKLHKYMLELKQGGSAEKPGGRRSALCAESMGGADTLSRKWRSGNRQRR